VPRPATFDHLRSKKKPLQRTTEVVLDAELAERYEEARTAVDVAQIRSNADPKDAQRKIDLAQAKSDLETLRIELEECEAVVRLTFRGIGRKSYDDLIAEHPPTLEQLAKAKKDGHNDLAFNVETFPPAIVAASLVEPNLSYEEVLELWDSEEWNQVELAELFNLAMQVNGTRRTVDLGKDLPMTNGSAPKSAGARSGASHTRSS
jgi:hypothetical protein